MLRKVRLPVSCLERPDLRIAVAGVRRLLEASAAAAGVDEFGLRMADRGGLSNLGPVALVVREQATIGDCDRSAVAVHPYPPRRHASEDRARRRCRHDHPSPCAAAGRARRDSRRKWRWEACIASSASLFGDDWRPLDVHLMHSPPRNRRYYRSFFGCNVIFNSEIRRHPARRARSGPSDSLGASADRAIICDKRVEAIEHTVQTTGTTRSRELVRALLPGGDCTIETRGRASGLRPADHSPASGSNAARASPTFSTRSAPISRCG